MKIIYDTGIKIFKYMGMSLFFSFFYVRHHYHRLRSRRPLLLHIRPEKPPKNHPREERFSREEGHTFRMRTL